MTMTKPTSEQVTFTAAGSGATLRNLVDKVRESVSAADFGAVGDGVADDTAALKAAFDYAIPLGRTVILSGTYKVTGPIQSNVQIASGQLHIACDGSVAINVANGSTPFHALMYFYTVASNNVSITGGTLSIDLNSLGATAFFLRQVDAVTQAGVIDIQTPVTVLNAHNKATSGGFSTADNGGIIIFGNYARVTIMSPTVIGVTRDAAAGVCRGITVAQYSGEVTIFRPYIKNVLTGAGTADADGISVAGAVPAGGDAFTDKRLGRSVIIEPTFVDCQGRSFKAQCSDSTVLAPTVFRKDVVSIASAVDFDFQRGNGRLSQARFEYWLDGSTSPLGSSFTAVSFQNVLDDAEMASSCVGTSLVTEVQMDRFALATYSSTAKASAITIDGLDIVAAGGLADTAITRAIIEFQNTTAHIVAMPGTATINVRNVNGPLGYTAPGGSGKEGCNCIGYTGYTSGAIASKLRIDVSNVQNTMPMGSFNQVFGAVSGTKIAALDFFVMRNCANMRAAMNTFSGPLESFDFATLAVGNVFAVDLSAIGSVSNAPPWQTGSGGYAIVEVLASSGPTTLSKLIRVTTFGTSARNRPNVWLSVDNATTWVEQESNAPTTKTADFTVAASEDVLIVDKASTCVVTLPSAATYSGRRIRFKTVQAQQVDSASSNVVPLAGGAAGTAILPNTAGKWADIVSNGTNWVIMAAN